MPVRGSENYSLSVLLHRWTQKKCRFVARILKECVASSCIKGPIFVSGDCIGRFQAPIFVSGDCIGPFQCPIFVSGDCIGPFQCDFIASSREKVFVRKNCIVLFDLFLRRLCIGVDLIDTFSSIAAHHWCRCYKFSLAPLFFKIFRVLSTVRSLSKNLFFRAFSL